MYSRGENVKKKSGKFPFLSIFFCTGPIILAKCMILYNVQLSKIMEGKSIKEIFYLPNTL